MISVSDKQVMQSIDSILAASTVSVSKLKTRLKNSGEYQYTHDQIHEMVVAVEKKFIKDDRDATGKTFKVQFDISDEDSLLASIYLMKKNDARRRDIEFSLTLGQMRKIVRRKTCYYSGRILERGHIDNKPTLERIDNTQGYIEGNVVVIAAVMNRLKNELFENPRSEIRLDRSEAIKVIQRMIK